MPGAEGSSRSSPTLPFPANNKNDDDANGDDDRRCRDWLLFFAFDGEGEGDEEEGQSRCRLGEGLEAPVDISRTTRMLL